MECNWKVFENKDHYSFNLGKTRMFYNPIRKIVEIGKIDSPNTGIHARPPLS